MNGWDVAGGVLVTAGIGFILVAAVGLIRFPDVYARLSAVTKAATLGVLLVLAGTAALSQSGWSIALLAAAGVLQIATAPVAGFTLARAAYRSGAELASEHTHFDELRDDVARSAD